MIQRTKEAYTALLEKYYTEMAAGKVTPKRYEFVQDEIAACKVMIIHCESTLKSEEYAKTF